MKNLPVSLHASKIISMDMSKLRDTLIKIWSNDAFTYLLYYSDDK
jgi:hypothetical protein